MPTVSHSLTIIIPAYNEENRLGVSFKEILNFYDSELFKEFEVIFVNDGSTDNTALVISDFIDGHKDINCRLISYTPNRGKGFAIKTGVSAAMLDYILMVDADMSTPLTEVGKFIPEIVSGSEIIIGSRKLSTSSLTKQQGWLRRRIGFIYGLISRMVSGLNNISDFGCGFKVFKTDVAQKIFPQMQTTGWVFDVEILYLFHQAGINIKQIGVKWHNDENSKLSFIKDSKKIFLDIIRIRLIHGRIKSKKIF